ncbi:MAG TPA: hypothetical protein VEB66_03405 [Opitutaceae bacterium]|nr:hypothetical protein [Opitutaceae bacterium]
MTAPRHLCWGAFAALLLVAAAVFLRWPTFDGVWSLDEANTAVYAQHLRAGEVLYRDVPDTRTPLMVYLLAAELAVIGDWNLAGQHLCQAVFAGLTALLLWAVAALAGRPRDGAWAAAVFTALSVVMFHPLDAFGISPEWYVNFLSAIGILVALQAWRGRPALGFAAGLAFGLSYLAKQPALFDLIAFAVWAGIIAAFQESYRRRAMLIVGLAAAGFVTVVLGSMLYFAAHGALDEYLFYGWTYSTRYFLPEVPTAERIASLGFPFRLAWENAPVSAVLVFLALAHALGAFARTLGRRCAGGEFPLLVLGWTVAGVLGSGLSGRESGHYCIHLLPGFSLAAGASLQALWERSRAARFPAVRFTGPAVAAGLAAFGLGHAFHRGTTARTLGDPVTVAGEIVRQHSTPEERILTWGFYPEVNFHARRLSASRFIYSNFLTGLIPWTNLDYEKDTSYAVVPGAWDLFWRDLRARPPAVIVDSRTARGYLKYPLERQARLWAAIQSEYVEIEPTRAQRVGYRIFRRVGPPLGGDRPAETDPGLALVAESVGDNLTGRVIARVPAGYRAAEFVIDGQGRGTVPLPVGGPHELVLPYQPVTPGARQIFGLRARHEDGTTCRAPDLSFDPSRLVPAPSIKVGPVAVSAAVTQESLGPMIWHADRAVFSAHAPVRLGFARPRGIDGVLFDFGVNDAAFAAGHANPTNGVGLRVDFRPEDGPPQRLLARDFFPRDKATDRGSHRIEVALPPGPGRILVEVTPGPQSEPSSDWVYLSHLTGRALPLVLADGADHRIAEDYEAPLGYAMTEVAGRPVVTIHAPARVEYALARHMRRITGTFGLLDASWSGREGATRGVDFVAEQVAPDGAATELWRRRLEPADNPADRGLHAFTITLAEPAAGRLRLRAIPAHPPDNSYGYAYWGELAAGTEP